MESINKFICPQCNNNHETIISNSMVICNRCILTYGLTDSNGESMTAGFRKNGDFYNEVNGNYSKSKTCYVNDKECYIMNSNSSIFIVLTKKINDLKIKR